jgi:hypothetical protein
MATAPDLNCISYWYPRLEEAGVLVPRTEIVRTDAELLDLLDGRTPAGFEKLIEDLGWAARKVGGAPLFLRTGHTSGKHDWDRTCYVPDLGVLGWHITALVEASANADMFGLPTQVWAVRELLNTRPLFHCRAYGMFPVVREFRCFVRDGNIEHLQPYWPPRAVAQGDPTVGDWFSALKEASQVQGLELDMFKEIVGKASPAVGGGYWSMDLLQDRAGTWWLTDMAEGDRSYRYDVAAEWGPHADA